MNDLKISDLWTKNEKMDPMGNQNTRDFERGKS